MKKLKSYLNQGFSLMETLIWVSIVGIFLSLIGVVGITQLDRAKVKGAKQELNVISAALIEYYDNEGSFPPENPGLQVLVDKDYIKRNKNNKLSDPWGTDYIYTLTNDGHDFIVKSLGSDKKEGGTGTAEDIIVSSKNSSNDSSTIEQTFDYGKDFKVDKN